MVHVAGPFHRADGQVRLRIQRAHVFPRYDKRVLVPCVAIAQEPCRKVQNARKEGNEHSCGVPAVRLRVHAVHDIRGAVLVGRDRTKNSLRHRHEKCRRDPLATHVADAEVQPAVMDKVIIEVATHLFGGHEAPGNIDGIIDKRFRGEHRLLDTARNYEFPVYEFLFGIRLVQAARTPDTPVNDNPEKQQAK